jgi:hypothetical protein
LSPDRLHLSEREIESAFIENHWNAGLLIHQRSAEALFAALDESSDPGSRHALLARLFGEYASTLETLAALGIAVRKRSVPGSLLRTYLSYRPGAVGGFYRLVGRHEGDLIDLLRLPSADVLIGLAVSRQSDFGADGGFDISIGEFDASLSAVYDRFKVASEAFFESEQIQWLVYNKIKHGAPLLRLFEPENDLRFEIPMRNPAMDSPGATPYQFAAFTASQAQADKFLKNTLAMTGSIRELGVLVKLMSDSDLLFRE